MSFRTSLLIVADANQAKGELRAVTAEAQRTTEATRALGAGSASGAQQIDLLTAAERRAAAEAASLQSEAQQVVNAFAGVKTQFASAEASAEAFSAALEREEQAFHQLRAAVDPLYRSSKQYEAAVEAANAAVRAGVATQSQANAVLAAAEAQYLATATGARQLSAANATATANLANLGAQFNDIGVMLAAGQSPLQLALQQGTQISQVLGPMGARGAVQALGAAFLGLLNPVTLITVGTIAAGAAMFNWLSSASGGVMDLDEVLKDAQTSADALTTATKRLSKEGLGELREEYGALTAEVRGMIAAEREALALQDQRKRAAVQQGLVAATQDTFYEVFIPTKVGPGNDEIDAAFKAVEAQAGLARGEVERLLSAFQAVESARGPEAQADAYAKARDLIIEIYGGLENLNAEQYEVTRQFLEAEKAARQTAGVDMVSPVAAAADEARRFADEILRAAGAVASLSQSGAVRLEEAQLRLQYAEDPVELARQLAVREMTRTQAELRAVAPSEELAALDAQAAAYGDQAAKAAAADAARQEQLANSRRSGRAGNRDREAVGDLIAEERERLAILRETNPVQQEMIRLSRTLATATGAERDEVRGLLEARLQLADRQRVGDLAAGLQDELDLMREQDPVQREMIRLRDELAGATDAERAAVEGLISEREREEAAIRQVQLQQDFMRDAAEDALDGMIFKGKSAADVMENLADSIARAALEAAIFGSGPFAGMAGTSGGGGIIGALGSALLGAFGTNYASAANAGAGAQPTFAAPSGIAPLAEGGMVYGPGGGTSDDVPAWLSSGEFVMPAAATRRYRHVLEAMRAGVDLPGFAGGGHVGAAPASRGWPAERLTLQLVNQSSTPLEGRVEETTDEQGGRRARIVLADAVGDALAMPGGGARKTMRNRYGIRPMGTVR